jgi:hypothetical protein
MSNRLWGSFAKRADRPTPKPPPLLQLLGADSSEAALPISFSRVILPSRFPQITKDVFGRPRLRTLNVIRCVVAAGRRRRLFLLLLLEKRYKRLQVGLHLPDIRVNPSTVRSACLPWTGSSHRWSPANSWQQPAHHSLIRIATAVPKFVFLNRLLGISRRLFCGLPLVLRKRLSIAE